MRAPYVRCAIGLSLASIFAGSAAIAEDTPPAPSVDKVESIVVTSKKLSVETLIDRKVYKPDDVQSDCGHHCRTCGTAYPVTPPRENSN